MGVGLGWGGVGMERGDTEGTAVVVGGVDWGGVGWVGRGVIEKVQR